MELKEYHTASLYPCSYTEIIMFDDKMNDSGDIYKYWAFVFGVQHMAWIQMPVMKGQNKMIATYPMPGCTGST